MSDAATAGPGADGLAEALHRQLGPLRRAALRVTRDAAGLPDLPEAQIEVLRVLVDGPLGPSELAARLRLARSTVSNLLRTMTAADLVERTLDAADLRTVRVRASPAALALLARYDTAGAAALGAALDALGEAHRHALDEALPALRRLTDVLAEQR